ncbi:MAG TPA: hypothetical protein P5569_12535, partial [Candidatus Latescibacteria bacterium]|nr:hypothetical protein [Candidatus Latescibacterota bacterium]
PGKVHAGLAPDVCSGARAVEISTKEETTHAQNPNRPSSRRSGDLSDLRTKSPRKDSRREIRRVSFASPLCDRSVRAARQAGGTEKVLVACVSTR